MTDDKGKPDLAHSLDGASKHRNSMDKQKSGPTEISNSTSVRVQSKPSSSSVNCASSPKKQKFKALGNLDGDLDVPHEELDALSEYISTNK